MAISSHHSRLPRAASLTSAHVSPIPPFLPLPQAGKSCLHPAHPSSASFWMVWPLHFGPWLPQRGSYSPYVPKPAPHITPPRPTTPHMATICRRTRLPSTSHLLCTPLPTRSNPLYPQRRLIHYQPPPLQAPCTLVNPSCPPLLDHPRSLNETKVAQCPCQICS